MDYSKELFEEFYKNIVVKEYKNLEKMKNDAKREKNSNKFLEFFLVFFGIIIYFFCSYYFKKNNWDKNFVILIGLLYFFGALLVFWFFSRNAKQNDYKIIFKEMIIKKLLLLIDNNLTYHPNGFIDSTIYNKADFEKYDKYYSDDFVSGKLKKGFNYILGDIKTEVEGTDRHGHRKFFEQFSGLFVSMECPKDFKESLYIRINKNMLTKILNYKLPYKKLKLDLDSSFFEKEFDVYASNKIIALQLLTSDIMQLLVDFKKEMDMQYEITIKDNHIYYRFFCGELFEPNDLDKHSLDKDFLYKYYKIMKFSLFLSEKLTDLIEDTEY